MPEKTPLFEIHRQMGAKLVDYSGWTMPIQYTSSLKEHTAVREAAGLFDASHMGEFELRGKRAIEAVNHLVCNDVSQCVDGQAMYAGLLNEAGGFVDDVIVYRHSEQRVVLCVNAGNIAKDWAWVLEHTAGFGLEAENQSAQTGMLALQGPKAVEILSVTSKLSSGQTAGQLKRYHFAQGELAGIPCTLSRTGYTGEDGFELYCAAPKTEALWWALLEAGKPWGLIPCGLGARDSLRLEMKYPLHGQDIDEAHTPFEAKLNWIVKMKKETFIGKAALEKQRERGLEKLWVGFVMLEPGIPRTGYAVFHGGKQVGAVTSGNFGPTVKRAIGMAYIDTVCAEDGTVLDVEIRERKAKAQIIKTPFLQKGA
ncbi:MAG: glycine cleavage system aminomethyltransferase GcvT [Proteobacteria bacterium]|nr:glycine cleavage system aminomethyltransferase GcvT [Cystobacterineae bacterium]MCL2258536.1 glycine cleavage system aminomethyltransferase GcvT [Cystobacterineae bacterium]MCL2315127.1 glycine cleavage system aminomethyltransferase GcvT [Pseudomonadota bacterium]